MPNNLSASAAKMPVAYAMFLISLAATVAASRKSAFGCYSSIISFGDSLADTGNQLLLCPSNFAHPPYGRTFFHHPTGRCSDGRLVIDFIAESLGLPLVRPYITRERGEVHGRSFSKGVNFAVYGATALDSGFYEKIGIHNPNTNVSLGTQLEWFRRFLATIPDHRKYLESSLVLVGEIGGNDYNYLLAHESTLEGSIVEVLQSFTPAIVNYIGSAIQELIEIGVVTMVVPGNVPIGCFPIYLTKFQKFSTKRDYDSTTGCLTWLNELVRYHNELLQKELRRIQELNPHVNLIYADYYSAAMRFYLSPNQFGFGKEILIACCGTGGPYNYNASAGCGDPQATCCDDPSSFASWDGVHLTEAANRLIAQGLLEGPYATPQITTICPNSISRLVGYYNEY